MLDTDTLQNIEQQLAILQNQYGQLSNQILDLMNQKDLIIIAQRQEKILVDLDNSALDPNKYNKQQERIQNELST